MASSDRRIISISACVFLVYCSLLREGTSERDKLATLEPPRTLAPVAVEGRGSYQSPATYMYVAAPSNALLFWQGFHWKWLREAFGFETPHRLGSVASYLTNVSSNCSIKGSRNRACSISGNYSVQFSPGVDGDYAFPKVYYSGMISKDSSQVYFLSGVWSFSFKDSSSTGPSPHADTTLLLNVTVSIPNALKPSEAVSVSLQGFGLEMKCIETPEHLCNSNASWTYYFNVSLSGPCTTSVDRKILTCSLLFALGRGWTPSHGGGKPYNYQMAFTVTVQFSAVVYQKTNVRLYRKRISEKGNIFQSPISGTGKLTNTSTTIQSAIIGLSELAWNMTGPYQERGRYLEELEFSLRQLPTTNSALAEVEYQWTMGYRAPRITTYASDVSYSVVMSALVMPQEWVQISTPLVANGTICKDDSLLFHCASHGLREQLMDHVTVYSQP